MATDRLRVEGNERLDLQDFQFILGEQQVAAQRQLLSQLICSPDRERRWVLSGFAITNPTGSQVQVTKGRGIFAEYRSGGVYYGLLTTEGDETKTVDINTYDNGLYGIYVRFEEAEGNFQPRIFWNASGLGSEYTETIATRYLANWSVRVEGSSPGDEWLQIGTVNRLDMALVDMRDFYFEGPVDGSYASGWSTDGGGIANDRNADRKTYGVFDFQKFSAATRQCLEDIKGRGLRRWWERDIGGMNLGFDANPVEDRLALGDADFYLDGGTNKRWQFAPNDHLTYDRTGNALTLSIGSAIHNWDATSQSPETTDAIDLGKVGKRYSKLHLGGDARFTRQAAGAGERNWQLSLADVGGFETLQLGSQSDAWDSFAAGISITRAADSGTITKITFPNGLYYDVANYALMANTTNGSLGKTGERWKYVYADTVACSSMQAPNITAETAFLPDANDGANLGASDKYFLNGWVTNLTFTNGVVNTALKPDANNGADLGDGSTYFSNGYISTLTIATKLIPDANDGADLGESGKYFLNGWVTNFTFTNGVVNTALKPDANLGANLGDSGTYFANSYLDTVFFGTAAGHGIASNLVPTTNGDKSLGVNGYRWDAWIDGMVVAAIENGGSSILIGDSLIPDQNAAMDLGHTSYRWTNGYINTVYASTVDLSTITSGASYVTINKGFYPSGDATIALGNSSYRWSNVIGAKLTANHAGNPMVELWNGSVNVPANEHLWRIEANVENFGYYRGGFRIWGYDDVGVANLMVLDAHWAGDGVDEPELTLGDSSQYNYLGIHCKSTGSINFIGGQTKFSCSVYPSVNDYYWLGDSDHAWARVYAHAFYCDGSHYNTSFDDYDDLALVDAYAPSGEYATLRQAGSERQIALADPKTLPWPMVDESGQLINLKSAVQFLLGAIKQLHQKVKNQAAQIARMQPQEG